MAERQNASPLSHTHAQSHTPCARAHTHAYTHVHTYAPTLPSPFRWRREVPVQRVRPGLPARVAEGKLGEHAQCHNVNADMCMCWRARMASTPSKYIPPPSHTLTHTNHRRHHPPLHCRYSVLVQSCYSPSDGSDDAALVLLLLRRMVAANPGPPSCVLSCPLSCVLSCSLFCVPTRILPPPPTLTLSRS